MEATAVISRRLNGSAVIIGNRIESGTVTHGGIVPTYYDGAYEFTPSSDTQTIPISGLMARTDITINPIPSNYGEIVWDGSILTVR